MSIVNEFKTKTVRLMNDPKQALLIDASGNRFVFPYDIYCHVRPMATKFNFFFHFATGKLLVLYVDPMSSGTFECGIMKFWVERDRPVPAAHWLSNMGTLMNLIAEQFNEQLASYTLDQIINSPDSQSV